MTLALMSNDLAAPERHRGDVVPAGERVFLHPGQYAVSATPCTMTTILGSCVGVCLFDPDAGVGGMNHYLLPLAPAGNTSLKYGDVALSRLIEELCGIGARRKRLQAKVAGGACVLDAYRGKASHVGRQNVQVAMERLGQAGIPVLSSEVEGERGRRLIFYPHTGDALVRSL